MKTISNRNSNVELVRIISMILIVIGHFSWQTNWNFSKNNILLESCVDFLWFGGKLGVDLFVLISAYFLSTQEETNFKSLRKLWLQVFYYSSTLTLFGYFILDLHLSLKIIIQSVFPLITGAYWFVTAYVIMVLFAPYINVGLKNLSKKNFQRLILLLLLIFFTSSVFQTSSIGFQGDESATLLVLYPFGFYLRKYKKNFIRIKNKYYCIIGISCLLLLFFSGLFINIVEYFLPIDFKNTRSFSRLFGSVSPFQLVLALCILILFLKLPNRHNMIVNKLSGSVFGVYLLHCHPLLINWIWNNFVSAERFSNSWFVFLYAGVVVSVIFAAGLLYDFVRRVIFCLAKNAYSKFMKNSFKPWGKPHE